MPKPVFRSYGTKVLVQINHPSMSRGGIALPEDAQVEPVGRGIIISCGPGGMTQSGQWDAPTVEVGDEILFHRGRAIRCPETGADIFSINMMDIIAVLRDEELQAPIRTLNTPAFVE